MSGVVPHRFSKLHEKYSKVLEEMDMEELKRYLFPNFPIAPCLLEEDFTKKLDGIFTMNEELGHVYQVSSQLKLEITMECSSSKYKAECGIKIGKRLSVNPLLFPSGKGFLVRRNGLKVGARSANLSAKYVMLCCFVVPIHWNSVARNVALACYDLYSKMMNFEMVIVAIMRDGWTHDKEVFRNFMSGFPSRCLAIPFSAKSHRRRVCKYLGGMFMANITLVAPNGEVLMHNEAQCCSDLRFVPRFHLVSSLPFPFIPDRDTIRYRRTPSSLKDFLCCKSSDFVFRKTSSGSEAFLKEKVAVSTLKSKLVGLYLYSSGHLFPLLREMEELCRQNDKELEIVVVYISSWHHHFLDPRKYPEFFSTVLAKQNISWWVAPYNNSASIVLENSLEGEKVIILGPNGLYADTYGAELMQIYGITAYPFTVKHVVQITLKELSKVTLESFLEMFNLRFEHHHTGKNVLFYFDNTYPIDPIVYDAYTRFSSDADVVILACSLSNGIVATEPEEDGSREVRGKISWLKNYHYKKVDKFFRRFFNHRFPTIIAFGKDGRICSVLAHRLPSSHGVKAWPIKCDLFEEVSSILTHYLEINDDYESKYLLCDLPDIDYGWEDLQKLRQSWMS